MCLVDKDWSDVLRDRADDVKDRLDRIDDQDDFDCYGCFESYHSHSYTSHLRHGRGFSSGRTYPSHSMSWRRRWGLGGSYYPNRYYACPPSGRFVSSTLAPMRRYSSYAAGVVPEGHSLSTEHGPHQQAFIPGYIVPTSRYHSRYEHTGVRALLPDSATLVSLGSFLLSPPSVRVPAPTTHRFSHLPLVFLHCQHVLCSLNYSLRHNPHFPTSISSHCDSLCHISREGTLPCYLINSP